MSTAWLAVPGFGIGLLIGYLAARRHRRRRWSFTVHLGATDESDDR